MMMKAHPGVMMGLRLMANDLAHCFLEGKPLEAEASVNLIVRSARKSQRGPSPPPPSPAQVIDAQERPGPGRPSRAARRKTGAPNPRQYHP